MPPRRSGNPAARAAKEKKVYSLARYREEATGDPFRLELDGGEILEIPRPTGAVMMSISERYADATDQNPPNVQDLLRDLLGDQYDAVMEVLGGEDFAVMVAFMRDLGEHFGLGEAIASLA